MTNAEVKSESSLRTTTRAKRNNSCCVFVQSEQKFLKVASYSTITNWVVQGIPKYGKYERVCTYVHIYIHRCIYIYVGTLSGFDYKLIKMLARRRDLYFVPDSPHLTMSSVHVKSVQPNYAELRICGANAEHPLSQVHGFAATPVRLQPTTNAESIFPLRC